MIFLKQNSENLVALTLKESSTLTSPFYLFKLTSVMGGNTKIFNATDISTATTRYNLFNIILSASTSENLSAGTVYIKSEFNGQFQYDVYESSAQTLSLSATTGSILETGICYISGSSIATEYNYTPATNNVYIYK